MNAIAIDAIGELREIIGVSRAAQLFGLARSSFYYQPVPKAQHRQRGGGAQPNALGEDEHARILDVLHSVAHVDHRAPTLSVIVAIATPCGYKLRVGRRMRRRRNDNYY